ncbi:6704_t:CDS:2 [Racocetra fulgida]|uniref:6704_t:CDS:1 n=1 Tax=Racocetra fulgida TaxID=60492 RepID=A0A9N9ANH3_9GLOM|nr:6704_t:CDS:2 [Racocetra fulgida]
MKYFTGDESGLIKAITFPKTSPQAEVKPVVTIWGEVDPALSIQMMCHAKILGGQKKLVVARRGGSIQIIDPYEEGKVCKEFNEDHVARDKKKSITKATKFVGLYAHDK